MKPDILDYDMTSAARSTSASTVGYAGTISGETGYGFAFGGNLTLQPAGTAELHVGLHHQLH
jgi:hypothetical protein